MHLLIYRRIEKKCRYGKVCLAIQITLSAIRLAFANDDRLISIITHTPDADGSKLTPNMLPSASPRRSYSLPHHLFVVVPPAAANDPPHHNLPPRYMMTHLHPLTSSPRFRFLEPTGCSNEPFCGSERFRSSALFPERQPKTPTHHPLAAGRMTGRRCG